MSSNEARRLGINYLSSPVMGAITAGGTIKAYRVKLDTVSVGSITLNNVDAAVLDGPYPGEILLGMTFLNRVQMTRDGDTLTLTRRY
jgi:aspartyl protease family protein